MLKNKGLQAWRSTIKLLCINVCEWVKEQINHILYQTAYCKISACKLLFNNEAKQGPAILIQPVVGLHAGVSIALSSKAYFRTLSLSAKLNIQSSMVLCWSLAKVQRAGELHETLQKCCKKTFYLEPRGLPMQAARIRYITWTLHGYQVGVTWLQLSTLWHVIDNVTVCSYSPYVL